MKILFWQWHSFMGKGMERALHRLNIAYDTFFYQMNDWESDDRFAEQLEKRISQQAYDAVISINFNPVISDVCQNHKLPYRAWVYDSPIHIRNVQALKIPMQKCIFLTVDRQKNIKDRESMPAICHWQQMWKHFIRLQLQKSIKRNMEQRFHW